MIVDQNKPPYIFSETEIDLFTEHVLGLVAKYSLHTAEKNGLIPKEVDDYSCGKILADMIKALEYYVACELYQLSGTKL